MKTFGLQILVIALAHAVVAEDPNAQLISAVKAKLEKNWTGMQVSLGVCQGCTGIETPESILISRKDGQISIMGMKVGGDGTETYTAARLLTTNDFKRLVNELFAFLGKAESEIDAAEYVASLSDAQREEYFKVNGRPIGSLPGNYIAVMFFPLDGDMTGIFWNAFGNRESIHGFTKWISDEQKKSARMGER